MRLETADATYFHFKTDIFKREITYSTDKSTASNLVTISAQRAFEVIAMNKEGQKPLTLLPEGDEVPKEKKAFGDILGDDDLTRFDKKKKKRPKGKASKPAQKPAAKPAQEPRGDRPADAPRKPRKPKPRKDGGEQGKPQPPKPPKE